MIKICLFCKNEFTTIPFSIKVGRGKYCSKPCYYNSMIGSKRPQWVKNKISKNHANLGKHLSKKTKDAISKAFWDRGGQSEKWKQKVLGQNNPCWKGQNASCITIHRLARKMYKLDKCEFCGKKNCMLHIANKSGKYKRLDSNDWLTLCVSCHKIYDLKKKR